jgi:hypothetical protein
MTLAPADTTNEAGGLAYALAPRHALAQIAATGASPTPTTTMPRSNSTPSWR